MVLGVVARHRNAEVPRRARNVVYVRVLVLERLRDELVDLADDAVDRVLVKVFVALLDNLYLRSWFLRMRWLSSMKLPLSPGL